MRNYLLRIEDNTAYEPNTGCWLWLAGTSAQGYGRIFHDGKPRLVHRLVYENKFGEIPHGLDALHHCDNPLCINPDHIFIGTQRDNNLDRDRKGRTPKGENHYRAKFDSLQIKVIRSIGKSITGRSLAKYFNCAESTISEVLSKRLWKHLYETIK